jgi:CofD-related protein of GAK system
VSRGARPPELGPRLLFFSGGTALRPLSRCLKRLTHNSVHLITPFDSGGSSAMLREAFGMLSIGDLRNRLVALADESVRGNPEIYRLFCHRLAADAEATVLRGELSSMVDGDHALMSAMPVALAPVVRRLLGHFVARMPVSFDLRGANVGNLMIAGGYLENERDIAATLRLFSKLLEVRGVVLPIVDADLQLAARLDSGEELIGQHLLTGKEHAPIASPIERLRLVSRHAERCGERPAIGRRVEQLIGEADLICYPMGSFYSSVLATLSPAGVGRAVAARRCPKVYIPNGGHDPEELGLDLEAAVERLEATLALDFEASPEPLALLDIVLLDPRGLDARGLRGIEALRARGLQVFEAPLLGAAGARRDHFAPELLAKLLISMAV